MPTNLKYGLTAGLATALLTLILFMLGMDRNQGLGSIGYLILLGALFLGVKEIRDHEMEGFISFGQAWKKAWMISIIAGTVAGIYMLIHLTIVNPDFIAEVLSETESQLEDQGMPADQIEMGMKMTRMFTTPWMSSLFTVLGYMFIGAILALIPAAVLKKEKDMLPL